MPNLLKKAVFILTLWLVLSTPACSAPPETTTSTASPTTGRPSQTAQPLPSVTGEFDTTDTISSPTPVPQNLLDAATTFEVIAAVHAHLVQISAWLPQGLSMFERQTIVQPIAQIRIAPLDVVFSNYLPHPELADSWQQAQEVYLDFYPQLTAWVDGDLADAEFSEALDTLLSRSSALTTGAEHTASQLGVETSILGLNYTESMDVVFRLEPINNEQHPSFEASVGTLAARQENPSLIVNELNPFSYSFAGMDVFLTIGLLENTGAEAQQGVEVEIEFFNFLGEHLGTLAGHLLSQSALPGKVYPFSASIVKEGEETALKAWVEYRVTVFSRPTLQTEPSYQEFEMNVSSINQDTGGRMLIAGTLTNIGEEIVSLAEIRIGVMAFDTSGILVGVGNGSVTGEASLSPGETIPIQAVLEAFSAVPASFQFFAEASQ